jgi:hypothetical protein
MPIPRHSAALPHVQLPVETGLDGVTELRVHGVGGTPPDAILGDLAPEQVSGDRIAGFYRSSDHHASDADRDADQDVNRHVEAYSWGGLTSRSKTRVLWLALLPFLLGNLSGWMCSAQTHASTWRFRLHRLAAGLGALALTVNAILITAMISADVLAYQAGRAGLAGHQWWLAPLRWHFISGYPARQVMLGFLVPLFLVLALVWLASTSWRYEDVAPPRRVDGKPEGQARTVTAAALGGGLADERFWDGGNSVRLFTGVHVGVVAGFLAIAASICAKAVSATGSTHAPALEWVAVSLGAAAIAVGIGYICLDVFGTQAPPADDAAADGRAGAGPGAGPRGPLPLLLVAASALICSGVFACLQPSGPAVQEAELPGMASVVGWTALAIVIPVALALISMLLGLRGSQGTLIGGPWVTLVLAFSVLNTLMLSAEIWVAHLIGPVTNDAAAATSPRPPGKIYLSYLITAGVPLVVWAAVLAGLVFAVTELVRWWGVHQLPAETFRLYRDKAESIRDSQAEPLKRWYWSCLRPFPPPLDESGDPGNSQNWEQSTARAQFLGHAPRDATLLMWAIIVAQLVMAVCVWRLHVQPPVVVRNAGIVIAGFALPALMAFLAAAWNDPSRRRTIGVLWDVGTFWPRSYHPLSPPCYTERAIPDLQRRMWWLHDNSGRVVLVAHSQGAVLATAALVQHRCRPEDDRPALVTIGSPVCKLYGWGFPAYVTPELLTFLAPGGPARVRQWLNFYYPTDPIGGPVAGDLPAALDGRVDRDLPDPEQCWYIYGQPSPAPRGHTGYWADPRVWSEINQIAALEGARDATLRSV